jgi:hypothetical protein
VPCHPDAPNARLRGEVAVTPMVERDHPIQHKRAKE